MRLDSLQGQLEKLRRDLAESDELQALSDFAAEVPEARHNLDACRQSLDSAPPRLRKAPEDRDRADKEMKQEAKVKDVRGEDVTYRRSSDECSTRMEAQRQVAGAAKEALARFAAFLKSPSVMEQLKTAKPIPKPLQEILGAGSADGVAQVLVTIPSKNRRELAKLLKNLLGNKPAKLIHLRDFNPQTDTVWDKTDIDRVAAEFRDYIAGKWEDGTYLKIEK
jgi:chromosome segregation ATPase